MFSAMQQTVSSDVRQSMLQAATRFLDDQRFGGASPIAFQAAERVFVLHEVGMPC